MPDLHYVRSTTSRGSCEISAYMNWNADIDLSQYKSVAVWCRAFNIVFGYATLEAQ